MIYEKQGCLFEEQELSEELSKVLDKTIPQQEVIDRIFEQHCQQKLSSGLHSGFIEKQLKKEFLQSLLVKVISPSEIAQRAYFLSQEGSRKKTSYNEQEDLLYAEQQLQEEAISALLKKNDLRDHIDLQFDVLSNAPQRIKGCFDSNLLKAASQLKGEALEIFAFVENLSCAEKKQNLLKKEALAEAFKVFNKTISRGHITHRAYKIYQ